jgi:hypothetical protein
VPYSIDPKLWDDADFVRLSERAQLLFIYLITGQEASQSLPGLLIGGIQSLAEARRQNAVDLHSVMAELLSAGFAEVDGQVRLVRIPRAPLMNLPGNTKVVIGWWRRWKNLPASPLKMRHLEPLRVAITEIRPWTEVWAKTFGTAGPALVGPPENGASTSDASASSSPPRVALQPAGKIADKVEVSDCNADDKQTMFGEKLTGKPIESLSESGSRDDADLKPIDSLSIANRKEVDRRSEIGDRRSEDWIPDPDPDAREPRADGPAPGTAVSPYPTARLLWALQEDLIAALPYETRPVEPTEADLRQVVLALDSFSADDLEYVLRLFAQRAHDDPGQARWFNRRANWHPAQIDRALRTPIGKGQKGRVKATRKRYGGSAFETP